MSFWSCFCQGRDGASWCCGKIFQSMFLQHSILNNHYHLSSNSIINPDFNLKLEKQKLYIQTSLLTLILNIFRFIGATKSNNVPLRIKLLQVCLRCPPPPPHEEFDEWVSSLHLFFNCRLLFQLILEC